MSVSDAQPVNAATSNAAWISKNTPDTMPNTLGLASTAIGDGSSIASIQKAANTLYAATGASEIANGTTYGINAGAGTVIVNGDSHETALKKLANTFDDTTGHAHTGNAGDGPKIAATSLSNTPITPSSVGSANAIGTTPGQLATTDHTHQGVHSLAASGGSQLYGDVLVAGANGTGVSQIGQYITIDSPALATSTPQSIGSSNSSGSATTSSKSDHVHQGVHSLAISGGTQLFGDATLTAGANVTLTQSGNNISIASSGSGASTAPKVTVYLTGSGTHTLTGSPLYIRLRLAGAGGGGSGGNGTTGGGNGSAGGNTTFGTTLLVANGGAGGITQTVSGAGGSASLGTGPVGLAISGGYGCPSPLGTGFSQLGGQGGSSFFGGAGAGGQSATAGSNGVANTGGGGGGGACRGSAGDPSGTGGGAGGYVDAIITSPSASYAYAVGSGGAGGSAGGSAFAGGAGGDGILIVEEFYQ